MAVSKQPQVPLQGLLNQRDLENPTLVPNLDLPQLHNGVLGQESPNALLQEFPRTDSTLAATVGGTITNGDTVNLVITHPHFSGGKVTLAYAVVTADTTTTIAEGLVNLVNNNDQCRQWGVIAEVGGTGLAAQVNLVWEGQVGNYATASYTQGGNSETITFGNSGAFAGGAGPVIAARNFTFFYNNCIIRGWYGKAYLWDSNLIGQLVAQAPNMPAPAIV